MRKVFDELEIWLANAAVEGLDYEAFGEVAGVARPEPYDPYRTISSAHR
jgi:hypothetical protein